MNSNYSKCVFLLAITGGLFGSLFWFAPGASVQSAKGETKPSLNLDRLNIDVPSISTDKLVKYDYPVVYVRAKRQADAFWANTEPPTKNPPGAELMILYPDGRQETLVGVQPAAAGSVRSASSNCWRPYTANLVSTTLKITASSRAADLFLSSSVTFGR